VKPVKFFATIIMALGMTFLYMNVSLAQDKNQPPSQSSQTTEATQTTQDSKTSNSSATITGEVIDVNCYLSDGKTGTGADHKSCAEMCAKAGVPLGILTSDGNIYYPIAPMGKNPNDKLVDYIAKQVTVSGDVFKQGSNYGIKIASIQEAK